MRSSLIRAAFLLILPLSGCGTPLRACPAPPTMNDQLRVNLFVLPTSPPNDAIRNAINNVKLCKPVHPVLGGPAEVNYIDTHIVGNGQFYVRFSVSGLSDISLVYLVDARGNLEHVYLYGT
jgi:hypothetical protein